MQQSAFVTHTESQKSILHLRMLLVSCKENRAMKKDLLDLHLRDSVLLILPRVSLVPIEPGYAPKGHSSIHLYITAIYLLKRNNRGPYCRSLHPD
jgi:hypothetical protein